MEKKKPSYCEALSHPTRLAIVELLSKRPVCVCEITKVVPGGISTVSRHLSIMKRAGILDSRKEERKVMYSLKAPCVLKFMKCVDEMEAR
ncbi:MAG: metalloregulator ArsR/SmtB family transcription factor [Planctomycetota bacterium]|nr:metalloregulator ArsR/SmtB family transcription factor [Planctomycetota bacterium]